MKKSFLILATMLFMVSVESSEAIEQHRYTSINSMIGADTQELESTYGKPTKVLTLSGGRRIYTYEGSGTTHIHESGRRCVDAYVVDSNDTIIDYFCR